MDILSKDDIQRFSRQLLVPEIGPEGQRKLRDSSVLIVGGGGLGCPVALYLAAAGLGTLGIVDFDHVSLDNLHRQVAHKEMNVGKSKTRSLMETVKELNSTVRVVEVECILNSRNGLQVVRDFDLVVDCSDNVATRYLVNDACVILDKPLVSGSALKWEGQLSVYHSGPTCPCYRCIFPVPPPASTVTNCSEGGVVGPVVGLVGSLQALETIKIIVGLPSSYAGHLFVFDGLSGRLRRVALRERRAECEVCGTNASIKQLIDYELFCGSGVEDKIVSRHLLKDEDRIRVEDYAKMRREATPPLLVDTRPQCEFAICHLPEALNVPLREMQTLDPQTLAERLRNGDRPVVVVCHRGNDSQLGVLALREKLPSMLIRDLVGGLEAWSQMDASFPAY